jgi:ornithine cyclodeaminase/alanine dehydrogenase-like protein (mu-crystallin family)
VAAKYLALSNSKTLGVIGPGWLATFQVEPVASACPIECVLVWGRAAKRRKDFIKQMSKVVKADWRKAVSVGEVKAQSDILVVSTASTISVAHGAGILKRKFGSRPSAPTPRSSMNIPTISTQYELHRHR